MSRLEYLFVVSSTDTDACVELPSTDRFHYPQVKINGKMVGAHRAVLSNKLGRQLVKGECACHSCDNRRCVNERHIFLGTRKDNLDDMTTKGRRSKHNSKQTVSRLCRGESYAT